MKLMLYIKCILVAIEGISATGLYKVSSSLVFLIGKVVIGIAVIVRGRYTSMYGKGRPRAESG